MAYLGIKKTHELMVERLTDYIKSQYFGENELLIKASDELLNHDGRIYQKPYIESAQSYKKIPDGIAKSCLGDSSKAFFQKLADKGLGVFKTPFSHQVKSLEDFSKGRNLFVATGTGSGKTECFMWPMIYKMFIEAKNNPESWKKRGIRTVIIYPMNALVSDQIARLRSMIGDDKGDFCRIFNESTNGGRRPQFGMYTGRTPYAGERPIKASNLAIADSYAKSFSIDKTAPLDEQRQKQDDIQGLKKIHKFPSKDMDGFIEYLRSDLTSDYNNSNDAELLVRFEMQRTTPDILITNYSMLEYMLIRKVENHIWSDTKEWLEQDKENKLLVIVDEAHMYSGASGGEVALLIRRLFARLGLSENKIQFIMTSASMPHKDSDDLKAVADFANSLSGAPSDSFDYIFGESQKLSDSGVIQLNLNELSSISFDTDVLDENTISDDIKKFAKVIFHQDIGDKPPRFWLYQNLPKYKPFVLLFNECRGNAVSYEDLLSKVIGDKSEVGQKALENLLLIAPLAKDENENVLFPARMHSFFRGLDGVFACPNPGCAKSHNGDHVTIGDLFTYPIDQCPFCHSKVYELLEDRRCGALFLKGYVEKDQLNSQSFYFWNKKGLDTNKELIELPLYLVPEHFQAAPKKHTEFCFLDPQSGKVYKNPGFEKTNLVKVLMPNLVGDDGTVSFGSCPKCDKKFTFIGLSDFRVKGNMPFYNIVKAQFDAQPLTKKENKFLPNGGKKVLLFSDSRQSAAILARDMTKIADMDSFRKATFLAMEKLYSQNHESDIPLSSLYPAFLEISIQNNLRFFYGRDLDSFEDDKNKLQKALERDSMLNRRTDYSKLAARFNSPSGMYQADLIELFCSPTKNFENIGLGYITPVDERLDDALLDLDECHLDKMEFIKIFMSFVYSSLVDSFAFDNTVNDNTRREVKYIKGNRYGFSKWSAYESEYIISKYPDSHEKIYQAIVDNFYNKVDENYFLNLENVKIHLTPEGERWTRCRTCGAVQPFNLDGHCSMCDSTDIEEVDCNKLAQIDYWRKPLLSDDPVKSLNTEEHTAQLSFKDQKITTWAKTEDYEMRFQDINVEKPGATPIDILSCTTTMEVGIDIGSLTAIGLRNVPPLRSNYQQRAGRAGRRGSSLSTISTYAQGGPHDTYYFSHPDEIIKGSPRRPWIDVESQKLLERHFNLVVLTKFFENKADSLYDCSSERFVTYLKEFESFVKDFSPSNGESNLLFGRADLNELKNGSILKIRSVVSQISDSNLNKTFFDMLFETGGLPTYSFPLDVVSFNIQNSKGDISLSPQRSVDIAIAEYAPGRTLVVDKRTYKSGGLYSPLIRKDAVSPFKQAEPYFDPQNGFYSNLYICDNPICGWFGTKKPEDDVCPFCGQPIDTENPSHMIKPWGFAPTNGREIPESEADSDLSYADEPCYSATPSASELKETIFKNIKISNRKNEEIVIVNKGQDSAGFDVCKQCGAAQLHDGKTLNDNGIKAPYTFKGETVSCSHKNVEEGVFLGTKILTDMFFMQIFIDTNKLTSDVSVLKAASVTLREVLKLSASRVLDIDYNDINVGVRNRVFGFTRFIDLYFYDSLSSGAGYSTQIEPNIRELFDDAKRTLLTPGIRDISNFWNQKSQYLFDKKLAFQLLQWATSGETPKYLSASDVSIICSPIFSILKNEDGTIARTEGDSLIVNDKKFVIVPAFIKRQDYEISDYEIQQSLPVVMGKILR